VKINLFISIVAIAACMTLPIPHNSYADDSMMIPASDAPQTAESAEEELGQRAAIRYASELFHNPSDPIGGNPQGKITLVEFFDFRCGHCVRMFPVLQDLTHRYPELRIVYKNYPVLGPASDFAAQAALAANKQGKYMVFQAVLFGSDITPDNVLEMAKNTGLDMTKLKADMKSEPIENEISATSHLADHVGLSGTPAFFIAKTDVTNQSSPNTVGFFPGEVSVEDLQQAIDKINH
jgi:protein-disulfide isomerase